MIKKCILLPIFLLFLTACGQQQPTERYSYIEVVDDTNEASLSQIEDIDLILDNSEVIIGLEDANEKYPKYNIDRTPAYIVFEYTGYLTSDMLLFTYEKDEAVTFIEEKIQEEKEREKEREEWE